jgi:hypothetical protein
MIPGGNACPIRALSAVVYTIHKTASGAGDEYENCTSDATSGLALAGSHQQTCHEWLLLTADSDPFQLKMPLACSVHSFW